MTQSRYSRLSALVVSPIVQQTLPTGNGFGGSILKIRSGQELALPIVSSSVLISDCTAPISLQNSSPLVIEVAKIAILAFWFWCLIAVNFCSDSIVALSDFCAQDS
jgi:hypothetical protein